MKQDAVLLSAEERLALEARARGRNTPQALAQRARLVLACAAGHSITAIARNFGVSRLTVSRWRRRFLVHRIHGLLDQPRPGAPRRITDAEVQQVVDLTLTWPPAHGSRWSTRSMAEACGLSQTTVSRIWRAMALTPDPSGSLKLAVGTRWADSADDIVGIFVNPPDRLLALSAHASARSNHEHAVNPGRLEAQTAAYVRHRTTALFRALDVSDRVQHRDQRQTARDVLRFLEELDSRVEGHVQIHLIFGDHATYRPPFIQRWLAGRRRYHSHFAQHGTSWLEVLGCWFAFITAGQLRRGVDCTSLALIEAVQRHIDSGGQGSMALKWTKPHAEARVRRANGIPVNKLQTHAVDATR